MTKEQERTIGDWELSCNLLAEECGKHLFGEDYDTIDDFWIGEQIGGLFDYSGVLQLTCENMAEVLKEGTEVGTLIDWFEANIVNEQYINLHSWLKGLRHKDLTNGNH